MHGEQRLVGMRNGRDLARARCDQRVADRSARSGSSVAGRPHADPDLRAGLVPQAVVAPDERIRAHGD